MYVELVLKEGTGASPRQPLSPRNPAFVSPKHHASAAGEGARSGLTT